MKTYIRNSHCQQNWLAVALSSSLLLALSLCLISFNAIAGEAIPIYSNSAQINSAITIDTSLAYYKDRELEEIEHIDAYKALLDLTIPLFKNTQMRLTWPAYSYTSGYGHGHSHGQIKATGSPQNGKSIAIDGSGGSDEFLSLALEYQLKQVRSQGYNLLAYGAYGKRTSYLETSYADTLNNKGELAKFGLKYDDFVSANRSNIFASLEYRHYWDSDELNPADDNATSFDIVNISGAWAWKSNASLHPVVGLTYQTDLEDYHAASVVPEIIYRVNSSVDVKLGVPVGLSRDADKYGLRFGLITRF